MDEDEYMDIAKSTVKYLLKGLTAALKTTKLRLLAVKDEGYLQ